MNFLPVDRLQPWEWALWWDKPRDRGRLLSAKSVANQETRLLLPPSASDVIGIAGIFIVTYAIRPRAARSRPLVHRHTSA